MPLKDKNGKELKEGDVVHVAFEIVKVHSKDEYASMALKSTELRKPDHEREDVTLSSSVCEFVMAAEEFAVEQSIKAEIAAEAQSRVEAQEAESKLRERKALEAQIRAEIKAEADALESLGLPAEPATSKKGGK